MVISLKCKATSHPVFGVPSLYYLVVPMLVVHVARGDSRGSVEPPNFGGLLAFTLCVRVAGAVPAMASKRKWYLQHQEQKEEVLTASGSIF